MNPSYAVQIIVPVYNAAGTLPRCLDSLLAQREKNWQAILIDDCSRDESIEILARYAAADPRFCVVRNAVNSGVSATRNRGLSLVDAEYVMFLDSDDSIKEDMIERMLAEAKAGSYDVVQCRYIYSFPNGRHVLPRGVFRRDTTLVGRRVLRVYLKMATGINMNHVCMKLIRTDVLGDLRFEENLRTGEDLVFCSRLFERVKRYRFLDVVFYHYFRGSCSLTGGGLPAKAKWAANRRAAAEIADSLRRIGVKNPFYYLLVHCRIYIITVSKVFRTLREKIILGRKAGQL